MRRLTASSILLLILGPFFAPVIAAATPSPVAMCCRRDGSHHCAAMAETLPASSDGFRANNPCPMRQGQQLATMIVALPPSSSAQVETARQLLMGSAISVRRFTPITTDHQRGPPALL